MAKFIVTQKAYRNGHMYEPVPNPSKPEHFFFCEDEDLGKHCDSAALAPADSATIEAILIIAPQSATAKKILAERAAAKKKAEDEKKLAEAKKKLAEARQKAEDEAK